MNLFAAAIKAEEKFDVFIYLLKHNLPHISDNFNLIYFLTQVNY